MSYFENGRFVSDLSKCSFQCAQTNRYICIIITKYWPYFVCVISMLPVDNQQTHRLTFYMRTSGIVNSANGLKYKLSANTSPFNLTASTIMAPPLRGNRLKRLLGHNEITGMGLSDA